MVNRDMKRYFSKTVRPREFIQEHFYPAMEKVNEILKHNEFEHVKSVSSLTGKMILTTYSILYVMLMVMSHQSLTV